MVAGVTRRRCILSTVGTLTAPLLAGCGRRIYDAPDLRVRNYDTVDREIHIAVTRGSESLVDDTVSLRPKKQAIFDTVFEEKGTYEIAGSLGTGESNAKTVKIDDLERDHIFNLTVYEEPTHRGNELISIGRIAP